MATASDVGQETPIPDCGEDFSDVEREGMAILAIHKDDYYDLIEFLTWIGDDLHNSDPQSEEGKFRKAQFYRVDEILRKKRVRRLND